MYKVLLICLTQTRTVDAGITTPAAGRFCTDIHSGKYVNINLQQTNKTESILVKKPRY